MIINSKDRETGGNFTFAMMGEDNPVPYEGYGSEGYKYITELAFFQRERGEKNCIVNLLWIILDSGSMVNLFYNTKLLANIKKASKGIWVNYNGGKIYTYESDDLDGYSKLWLCRRGITNKLLLERQSIHTRYSREWEVYRPKVRGK